MKFTVYVIQSESSGKIYIGHTQNFEVRLKRHNKKLPYKKRGYTATNIGPWKQIYKEEVKTKKEARVREKQLKSYQGREFIRKTIKGP